MHRRPTHWTVNESKDGDFTVMKGGRVQVSGMTSKERVHEHIEQRRGAGERVTLVEPDGYRTDITKQFKQIEEPVKTPAPARPKFDPKQSARERYLSRYGRPRRR